MVALIVEDGSGIWEANAYAGIAYVHAHLHARGRSAEWDAATSAQKAESIVRATDYIDRRFGSKFKGQREHTDLVVSAFNFITLLSQPGNNNTLTIGSVTYRFRVSMDTAYDVAIGADVITTRDNLVAAINASGTPGTEYFTGTLAHPDVNAIERDESVLEVQAKIAGSAANNTIDFSTSSTDRISIDYPTLQNGSDSAEQQLEWPRLYVYNNNNQLITGIPEKLRQATAEYAFRSISSSLMPDPTTDDTGQLVSRAFDKVGPIETEREYVPGSAIAEFKKYPEADRLLREYINGGRGVVR